MLKSCKKYVRRVTLRRLAGWASGIGAGVLTGLLITAAASALAGRHLPNNPEKPHYAPVWPYPDSLDAPIAAPKFHRVLFENDRVRVLEVTVPPHIREPLHNPPLAQRDVPRAELPVALFRRQRQSPARVAKPYQQGPAKARARWQEPEAPHSVENMGDVADRFIRVEYKQ